MTAYVNRARLIAAAILACTATTSALAGDFMVRARALRLDPANDGTDTAALVRVNTKFIWEIDASYCVTPNWAVELIATTPQKQSISLETSPGQLTAVGTLRHLPPTLTAQYHFAPANQAVRPYLGFGVNYTHFSAVNITNPALAGLDIQRHSWGTAVQLGADFPLSDKLSLNVDFKKIDIRTKATLSGASIGTIKVDPVLFGIGIGYRF
ncbi:MAG: OmpW family outer membrane protein [Aquabacterium sp.]